MSRDKGMTLRKGIKLTRYALCGAILGIAFAQGFFPEIDINSLTAGSVGAVLAGIGSAKALAFL